MSVRPHRALLALLRALSLWLGVAPVHSQDAPPPDGTLDAITLLHATDRSLYYAITYWSDGLRVTGYLGRPRGLGPFPAIIHCRGGYDEVGALTGVELAVYVEAGYVAVATQYRGNAGGEGREDFGGDDVHDVLNLLPLLRTLPYVDMERVGMFGGSRGGMMTYIALKELTLAGQGDAIKAAVTRGGISDLFAWDRERGGALANVLWRPLVGVTPAEAPELFEARSAVYWPELIGAPLLMLHGQADREVSVQQTLALATAFEEIGVVPRYLLYPNGDHPLTQYKGGYPDALDWFALYLGGDGVDRSYETHEYQIVAVQTWFQAQQYQ